MSKLCQCKQDTLRALVLGTATGAAEYEDEDDLDDFAYEQLNAIVKLLESDCVCEKKEENENESNYTTSPQSCRVCGTTEVTTLVHGACLSCIGVLVRESVMKEKNSQPHCEHEWEKIFLPAFTVLNNHWQPQLGESPNSLFPLYICRRKACGLVTCKNPNDK